MSFLSLRLLHRPLLLAATLLCFTQTTANAQAQNQNSSETMRQLSLFSDVLERVRADYVDEVTDEKLMETAINGMLTSLDPHSSYLNKKDFQDMQVQTKGEFGGLGIEVTMEDNIIKVVSPIDDTPAFKAGLQPNDLITHIDENPVTEMTLSEAVEKMRGTPGTKIKLTIRRGGLMGEPFDVTLTRAIIKIESVRSRAEGDVGYIRITTFNELTQPGLNKAIESLQKELGSKLVGYVLDLRNNPGGLLDQAVSVSSTFIARGEVVSTRGRHSEDNQIFTASGEEKIGGKPLVVLINGGSASASEIVAGALQDHRRAILLGTKSFGKGSVQTIIPLQGAGAMRLTTARYYTPSGRSIQAEGIEPDIVVEQAKVESADAEHLRREADLKGALKNPQNGDKKPDDKKTDEKKADDKLSKKDDKTSDSKVGDAKASDDKTKDDKAKKADADKKPIDYQLARALDLVRGVALFEQRAKPR